MSEVSSEPFSCRLMQVYVVRALGNNRELLVTASGYFHLLSAMLSAMPRFTLCASKLEARGTYRCFSAELSLQNWASLSF